MKRIICFILFCAMPITISAPLFAQSERTRVPHVAYIAPDNDAVIDLTGKDSLLFQWKGQPKPGGGREAFRFVLYKGFSYETLVSQVLKPDVFSIETPADKFEDGATYSWHVQQRDASNMVWGLFDSWSFRVSKKKG